MFHARMCVICQTRQSSTAKPQAAITPESDSIHAKFHCRGLLGGLMIFFDVIISTLPGLCRGILLLPQTLIFSRPCPYVCATSRLIQPAFLRTIILCLQLFHGIRIENRVPHKLPLTALNDIQRTDASGNLESVLTCTHAKENISQLAS